MTDQHVSGKVAGPEGLREPNDFNALAMSAGANAPFDPKGQSRAVQTEDGMVDNDLIRRGQVLECLDIEADSFDDAAKWGGAPRYVANCKAAAYALRNAKSVIEKMPAAILRDTEIAPPEPEGTPV
jgi:hypothetical protein